MRLVRYIIKPHNIQNEKCCSLFWAEIGISPTDKLLNTIKSASLLVDIPMYTYVLVRNTIILIFFEFIFTSTIA